MTYDVAPGHKAQAGAVFHAQSPRTPCNESWAPSLGSPFTVSSRRAADIRRTCRGWGLRNRDKLVPTTPRERMPADRVERCMGE